MGRDGAVDIIYISGSFTAGAGAAALILPLFHSGMPSGAAAAAAMVAAGVALAVFALRGRSRLAATPVFAALGICCYATSVAAGVSKGTDIPLWQPAAAAAERLKAAIASLPLKYDGSSELLTALLTGDKGGLTPEIKSAFRDSGASHILALSGLHLGFLYGILKFVLAPLGRSRPAALTRSIATVAAAIFYALMTGCSPSIVRALLFIALNEFSGLCPGRRKDPLAILCAALTIQLTISPQVISSTGFQLSYLAMLGIFIIFPRLRLWYPSSGIDTLDRYSPLRKIWNSAALTLSCQAFTAPLVWKRFGSIPHHFLLTNLLALPLTELLILGAVSALALDAFGICPAILTKCVDSLAHALIFTLQVISSM